MMGWDRQCSLIVAVDSVRWSVRIAHSAARDVRRDDRVELADCVNLDSCENAENSEGSDKSERLHGSCVLTVPIESVGRLDLTALTGEAVRVRAVKWGSAL